MTPRRGAQKPVDAVISTAQAAPRQRRLAALMIGLSLIIFVAAAPFAAVPLPTLPAFIPAYEAALVVIDAITALLLFGQFFQRGSPALLALAAGYLFDGMIIVPHALTFPGVMSPSGWLGAGVHTTAWLYMFWHGGFPLFVIAYSWLNHWPKTGSKDRLGAQSVLAVLAGTIALVIILTLLATKGHDALPPLMTGNTDALGQKVVVLVVWTLTAAAFLTLLFRRPYAVLDLWLLVVMVAWLADIGLSAVFDAARYDLGFYAGRLYGLLAASVVLGVILIEASGLQRLLAAASGQLIELNRTLAQRVHERTADLRASEERMRLMTDSVRDYAIMMLDRDGRVVTWNQGAQRLQGYAEADIVGQSIERFYQPEDVAAGKPSHLMTLAAAEGRSSDSGWLVRKDGSRFFADVVLTAMRDPGGNLVGFTEITRDITERRQAELKIREQMERAEALLEAAPDPIVIVDGNGRIVMVNARTETVFGYSRTEMVGQPVEMLLSQQLRVTHVSLRQGYMEAPTVRQMGAGRDLVARRSNGEEFPVDVSLSPLSTSDGPLIISTIRDVSERRRAEAQLHHSQKMEAIGNLTGGLAHDFNNLLGIVIGNLDLMRDFKDDGSDIAELTQDALDAALRGAELTRRLLAFARQQPLQPRHIDVNELVSNMAKLLSRTLGEDIEIVLDPATDVWPIIADPAQLESSLVNLANNSRDAMRSGGRLIIKTGNRHLDADYAAMHAEVVPGDYAMIEVSDTGAGMPPEILSHVFEPFFTTKEQGKGTGLGLSMVFGFMKQSHGHINVYSEIGVGTTFRLYLPRAIEQGASAEEEAAKQPAIGGTETILVVEDNPGLRKVVVRQLTELGYRVIEAENAKMAFDALGQDKPHLMMTDVIMPGGMDGIALAREVSARHPSLKILFTSGFAPPQISGTAWALPPNARLLAKPYRKDELAEAIRAALDG